MLSPLCPLQIPDLDNACGREIVFHFPTFGAPCDAARVTGANCKTNGQPTPLPPPPAQSPSGFSAAAGTLPCTTWDKTQGSCPHCFYSLPPRHSAPGCHCRHCPTQALTVSLAANFTVYGAEGCGSATVGPWRLPDPGGAGGPAATQHPFSLAHAPWTGKSIPSFSFPEQATMSQLPMYPCTHFWKGRVRLNALFGPLICCLRTGTLESNPGSIIF